VSNGLQSSAQSQPPTRALHLRVGSGCRAGSSGRVGNGGLEGRGFLDGSCWRPDMPLLSGRNLILADSQFLQGKLRRVHRRVKCGLRRGAPSMCQVCFKRKAVHRAQWTVAAVISKQAILRNVTLTTE
jgi:hypothetical protein